MTQGFTVGPHSVIMWDENPTGEGLSVSLYNHGDHPLVVLLECGPRMTVESLTTKPEPREQKRAIALTGVLS